MDEKKTLKVIKVNPAEKPVVVEIDYSLESLQREVDGYIECVYPYEDMVALIVNEEGKCIGMDLNRALRDEDGEIYDIIAGPFLIAGIDDCDFCDIPEELIDKYMHVFETPEIFFNLNGKIHVIPVLGLENSEA